jgi:hypothetical protein
MVPLAVFSSKVPSVEHQALAKALLKVEPSNPLRSSHRNQPKGKSKLKSQKASWQMLTLISVNKKIIRVFETIGQSLLIYCHNTV